MTEPESFTEPTGHEPDALNLRSVACWAFALALLVGLTLLLTAGLKSLFEQQAGVRRTDQPANVGPVVIGGDRQPPPEAEQLSGIRAAQRRRLEEYAWVDRRKRIVRIPIERAMQLLLERGLPVRGEVTDSQRAPKEPDLGSPQRLPDKGGGER